MYVLADANVWLSSRLFTSSIGAAVTFYLSHVDGRILLPRVTELELEKLARRSARDAEGKIDQAFAAVNRLTYDYRPDYPDEAGVVKALKDRVAEIDRLIERPPMTIDRVMSALDRVLDERAPSGQKEQFRDALLWEEAVATSSQHRVEVVTADTDFYVPGEHPKRPAPAIASDMQRSGGRLHLHPDLPALLKALKQEVPGPDHEKVAHILDGVLSDDIDAAARDHGWQLGEMEEARVAAFPAGKKGKVALSFELVYPATQETPEGRVKTTVVASGSCTMDRAGRKYDDISLSRIEFAAVAGIVPFTILYRAPKPAG